MLEKYGHKLMDRQGDAFQAVLFMGTARLYAALPYIVYILIGKYHQITRVCFVIMLHTKPPFPFFFFFALVRSLIHSFPPLSQWTFKTDSTCFQVFDYTVSLL